MNQEQQQSQLKQLIAKGKEQGYLTYAQVNDHLPPGIVEPEQIEDIIRMINDMGITVHETAPDIDDQNLSDAVNTDEDAAEAAAAALATVDSEFGRTTDPVRMYMREMGTVELLTREGELKIAKRIEEGLNQVLASLSHYPTTIGMLLERFDKVKADEMRLTDVISGFVDPNAPDTPPKKPAPKGADAENADEEEETPADTGPDPEEAAKRVTALRKLHKSLPGHLKKHGTKGKRTQETLEKIATTFLELKLIPAVFVVLVTNLRKTIGRIRNQEKAIMYLCVDQSGMTRKRFITSFPDNETNLDWLDEHYPGKTNVKQ